MTLVASARPHRRLARVLGSLLVFAAAVAAACATPPVRATRAVEHRYANPVFDADFPDPTVVRAPDGQYYAYATQSVVPRADGAGRDTVNMQLLRSADLVHWARLGDALPVRPPWASRTRNFWAPHVSTHAGRWYLYYSAQPDTALRDTTQGLCLAVATASRPEGPFTDIGRPLRCGASFVNIDPMQFDDPRTGVPLLYWGSGFGPILVQPLAPDRVSFAPGSRPVALVDVERTRDTTRYQRLVEGAWVHYEAPWYFLFYSGDNCCGPKAHYAVMVARSRSATGPFETLADATGRPQSVILTRSARWNAPGHNSVVRDATGAPWLVYHAIDVARPRADTLAGIDSRRVMLVDPLRIVDGWPAVAGGQPSEDAQPAPRVPGTP